MVEEKKKEPRCGECQCVIGNVWCGFVYCHWLKCDVYADSLMCQHGLDLLECF